VWRSRRRLRELENEVATARADQAELRRRLQLFEDIAAAAGSGGWDGPANGAAAVGSATPAVDPAPGVPPVAPVPPELLAAARELRSHGVPVRLEVEGSEFIAVIEGPGDPARWWQAIREIAAEEEPP
jgi:hypothetical protein